MGMTCLHNGPYMDEVIMACKPEPLFQSFRKPGLRLGDLF